MDELNPTPVEETIEENSNVNESTVNGSTNERPDWLPDNFKSAEDFADSYKELQSKFTKEKQGLTTDDNDDDSGDADSDAANDDDGEHVPNVSPGEQLDFDSYSNEFAQTGELSEASRDEIKDTLGVSDDVIDMYLAGIESTVSSYQNAAFEITDGEGNYEAMQDWASQNLTEEQQQGFDSALHGSRESGLLAVKGLYADYVAANGQAPTLIGPESGSPSYSGNSFETSAEMTEAIADPRYKTDENYRNEVMKKIMNSDVN